jgi:hypothetical protein
MILAVRRPSWWLVTGLSAGLAFLQKSPGPLLLALSFVALLYLLAHIGPLTEKKLYRASLTSVQLKLGALFGFVLISFWPLVQIVRHGTRYLDVAFRSEIIDRFAPAADESSGALSVSLEWIGWMSNDAVWFWMCGLCALAILTLFTRLRRDLGTMVLLATVALFLCLFTVAGGKIYPRYLIQVAPLMSAVLAIVAAQVVKPRALLPLLALLFVAATGKVFHDPSFLLTNRNESLIEEVVHFSERVGDMERAIFFTGGLNGRLPPGLIVHYAHVNRPVELIGSLRKLRKRQSEGLFERPHRAFSTRASLGALDKELGEVAIVEGRGKYVIWRAVSGVTAE